MIPVRETPREVSFCGHTILGPDVMLVADTQADPRFADNPLVQGVPGIRFYAGVPIELPDGARVGALCAVDRVPRSFDEEQLEGLLDMAALVTEELARRDRALANPITDLPGRLAFTRATRCLFDRMAEEGGSLRFLHVTVHMLHRIDERYGREGGDEAIGQVAEALRRTFRSNSLLAHVAADQFCVACPGLTQAEEEVRTEQLQEHLAATNLLRGSRWPITVSIRSTHGIPEPHQDWMEWLARTLPQQASNAPVV